MSENFDSKRVLDGELTIYVLNTRIPYTVDPSFLCEKQTHQI